MTEVLTHNQIHASPQQALLHYGVKGMRWGVTTKKDGTTTGTPSARQVRKEEKQTEKINELRARSAKAAIRSTEIRDEIASTPQGFKGAMRRNTLRNELAQNESYRKTLDQTAERVEKGGLTPGQKQLLIGGAIVGGLVIASYASTKIESGEAQAFVARGKAKLQGKPFEFERNILTEGRMSADDISKLVTPGINPGYDTPGGQMNCRRCTFTYELRRRGYDVEATRSSLGIGQSESGLLNALTPGLPNLNRTQSLSMGVTSGRGIRALARGDSRKIDYHAASVKNAKDHSSFLSAFKDQPDGARGESVFNFSAFGHSLAYEKINGQVYLFDTQKNQRYNASNKFEYESFLRKWGYDRVQNVEITRLDNMDLDTDFLARWSTNRSRSNPRNEPDRVRPANMSEELWRQLQGSRA